MKIRIKHNVKKSTILTKLPISEEKMHKSKHILKRTGKISRPKCVDLIFHGGIEKNLVTNCVIENMNLECDPHPKPYKLSWLQKRK